MEDLEWMRVECHHRGYGARSCCDADEICENPTVTKMQPVKIPDGQCASLVRRKIPVVVEDIHWPATAGALTLGLEDPDIGHLQVVKTFLQHLPLLSRQIPTCLFLKHFQNVNGLLSAWQVFIFLTSLGMRGHSQLKECSSAQRENQCLKCHRVVLLEF